MKLKIYPKSSKYEYLSTFIMGFILILLAVLGIFNLIKISLIGELALIVVSIGLIIASIILKNSKNLTEIIECEKYEVIE